MGYCLAKVTQTSHKARFIPNERNLPSHFCKGILFSRNEEMFEDFIFHKKTKHEISAEMKKRILLRKKNFFSSI